MTIFILEAHLLPTQASPINPDIWFGHGFGSNRATSRSNQSTNITLDNKIDTNIITLDRTIKIKIKPSDNSRDTHYGT